MSRIILAAVDDMFFASKIRAVAEAVGAQVKFPRSLEATLEAARADAPSLVIADLHGGRLDPLQLAREFKEDEQLRTVPLIGFFSHVETALGEAAVEAGYDQIMPRSAFTNQLPLILSGEL